MNPPTLLFDGVCNLCSSAVQFILRHEKAGNPMVFGSLQSEAGKAFLKAYGLGENYLHGLVYIENDKCYFNSTGALKLAAYLRPPYSWLQAGWVLPAFIRDGLYRLIARNRYAWFGKKEECWLPTPELRARFID